MDSNRIVDFVVAIISYSYLQQMNNNNFTTVGDFCVAHQLHCCCLPVLLSADFASTAPRVLLLTSSEETTTVTRRRRRQTRNDDNSGQIRAFFLTRSSRRFSPRILATIWSQIRHPPPSFVWYPERGAPPPAQQNPVAGADFGHVCFHTHKKDISSVFVACLLFSVCVCCV